jgi:hypothetical protein
MDIPTIEVIPAGDDHGPCVAIEYLVADLEPWLLVGSSGHAALLSAARRRLKAHGYNATGSTHTRRVRDDGPDRIRIVFGLAVDA